MPSAVSLKMVNGGRSCRFCCPGDWLERSMAFDQVYGQQNSIGDILPERFSLAVIFNSATNQDLCTAIVVTKNYVLTTVQGMMAIRANGSRGILPLSILNLRVEVKKRSFVFPLTAITLHPDKQLALIKLADLSTLKVLKPIKLAKKTPKEGKEVLVYRVHHSKSVCQYTKIASVINCPNSSEYQSEISGISEGSTPTCSTEVARLITIEATLKNQRELRGSPVIYKNRLVGLMLPGQFSKSGQMLILNVVYYLQWIRDNSDYKRRGGRRIRI